MWFDAHTGNYSSSQAVTQIFLWLLISELLLTFLIAVISPWIHPELPYIPSSENIEPVWGAWAECAPRHHVKGIRVKIQVVFFPKITPKHEAASLVSTTEPA